jgi:hypothetical protein
MSFTSDYFDYHLTPTGWVRGSTQEEYDSKTVDIPKDRLITVQEHVYQGSFYSQESVNVIEIWRSPDKEAVAISVAIHGETVKGRKERKRNRP